MALSPPSLVSPNTTILLPMPSFLEIRNNTKEKKDEKDLEWRSGDEDATVLSIFILINDDLIKDINFYTSRYSSSV